MSQKERRLKLQERVENLMKQFLPDVDLKIRRKKKPAWSLTQAEAEQARAERENSVIQFMDDLDYDQVIEELEVKHLLCEWTRCAAICRLLTSDCVMLSLRVFGVCTW